MKKNYNVLRYNMLLIDIMLDFNATEDESIPQNLIIPAEILICSVIESLDILN